jgi:hypothetical protein
LAAADELPNKLQAAATPPAWKTSLRFSPASSLFDTGRRFM